MFNPRKPSQSTLIHRSGIILPAFILFLGFILRVYRLDYQPFTGDEAFTIVNWTTASPDYLFGTIATIDPQPPIALFVISAWIHLVGDSEFASRTLSMLAGTITLAASYTITKQLAGRRPALIAVLLCTINPFLIWHSQDLRPYSLWIATSSLSLCAFLSATTNPRSTKQWLAYTILAVVTMYTYYLEAFNMFAQNIIVATRCYKNHAILKVWIPIQSILILALMPWYLRPEILHSGYQPTAAMPDIPQAIQTLLVGDTLSGTINTFSAPLTDISALILLLFTILAVLALHTTRPKNTSTLLTSYSLVPILALSALALFTQRGYFRPRYLAATALPLLITIALLLDSILSTKLLARFWKLLLISISTGILFLPTARSLIHYYYEPDYAKAPDWRALAATLRVQTAETDLVVVNYPDPSSIHYFTGPAKQLYLPTNPNPHQQDIDQQIATLLADYSNIWFVPIYIPTWDRNQTVSNALSAQSQLISQQQIATFTLLQYATWQVTPSNITNPQQIPIGDLAVIEGYRTTPPQDFWTAGDTIYIEVFWKPLRTSKKPLTVFSHLLGPTQSDGSPLWAQDDYPPQDGQNSTTSWTPGTLIRDTYTLQIPDISSPTTYTITLGLYDPQTNERYQLSHNTPQAEPNGATLLTFTITP